MTIPFQRRHDITIAAPADVVFDYVTNPQSWPKWLPSSHRIDSDNRPMEFGDTFHESWHTRTGEVQLDWLVITCDHPRLWIGMTYMSFLGPVVVQYNCDDVPDGTRFTRTVRNPARPKAPTPEMIQRMDEEAKLGLASIKTQVEALAADQ